MKRKKIRLTIKDRFKLSRIKKLTTELESVISHPKRSHLARHKKIRECQKAVKDLDNEYFKPRVEEVWEKLSIKAVHPRRYYFRTFELLIKHQKNLLSTDSVEELKKKLK